MSTYQLIYKTSDEKIYTLYKKLGSITKVLSHFDVKGDPRIRTLVSQKISNIAGNNHHSIKHSKKATLSLEIVVQHANECSSLTQLIKALGLQPVGSNFTRVSNFIRKHNITFGKQSIRKKFTNDEVYIKNSTYSRNHLSGRVKRDKWLQYKCEQCHNDGTWCNGILKLHVDHKNGINNDHRKENLRWLCPNCHSQTPTYAGKNNKK